MISNVLIDLNVFFIYFFVQVIAFTMTFSVVARHDGGEYREVGALTGNFLYAMRLSLGDFNFDAFERTSTHTLADGTEVTTKYMNGSE